MPIQGKAKSNISHLIPCKGAQLFPGEATVHSVSVERFMLTAERARKHAIPPPTAARRHMHTLLHAPDHMCVHASTCMHTYKHPIVCEQKHALCVPVYTRVYVFTQVCALRLRIERVVHPCPSDPCLPPHTHPGSHQPTTPSS